MTQMYFPELPPSVTGKNLHAGQGMKPGCLFTGFFPREEDLSFALFNRPLRNQDEHAFLSIHVHLAFITLMIPIPFYYRLFI